MFAEGRRFETVTAELEYVLAWRRQLSTIFFPAASFPERGILFCILGKAEETFTTPFAVILSNCHTTIKQTTVKVMKHEGRNSKQHNTCNGSR